MIAIVLGATGLVGSSLVNELIADARYTKIKVIVRRPYENNNPKIESVVIDFDNPESWKAVITGDVLFSAFGTTIKKAGSKAEQYKIDYTYQYQVAKAAAENLVSDMVIVSSAGADSKSSVFYSRMKGELDDAIQALSFKSISILKPSLLLGNRNEKRSMERIAMAIGKVLNYLPFASKYKPIEAQIVAKAMIGACFGNIPVKIYSNLELFKLAHN